MPRNSHLHWGPGAWNLQKVDYTSRLGVGPRRGFPALIWCPVFSFGTFLLIPDRASPGGGRARQQKLRPRRTQGKNSPSSSLLVPSHLPAPCSTSIAQLFTSSGVFGHWPLTSDCPLLRPLPCPDTHPFCSEPTWVPLSSLSTFTAVSSRPCHLQSFVQDPWALVPISSRLWCPPGLSCQPPPPHPCPHPTGCRCCSGASPSGPVMTVAQVICECQT